MDSLLDRLGDLSANPVEAMASDIADTGSPAISCLGDVLVPAIAPPTTTTTTTTIAVAPEEHARAMLRAVSPMADEERSASSQFYAAMTIVLDDPSQSYLLGPAGQKLVDVYATRMFAWSQSAAEIDALGEPYVTVFAEMRHGDEMAIDAAKAIAACSSGCDGWTLFERLSDATTARGKALIKLGALIGTG
ncbi:MAG: hypothetical protein U0Q22_07835 [Acidimicrobiales bacterium]